MSKSVPASKSEVEVGVGVGVGVGIGDGVGVARDWDKGEAELSECKCGVGRDGLWVRVRVSDGILPREGLVLLILLLQEWSRWCSGPEIGDGVEGCLLWGRC